MKRSIFDRVTVDKFTADYAEFTVKTRPYGECLRIRVSKNTLKKLVDRTRIFLNEEKFLVGLAEFRWHRQESSGLYANYSGKARLEVLVGGPTIIKIVVGTMHDPKGQVHSNVVAGSIVLDYYYDTESVRAALCKLIDKMDMMF